ncbi:MAG TPA: trigger factor [Gaiellaceae bacterium]|jgi:trigger factor|nr:trigger factor [Gaiellaceae bacterium]
MATQVEELPDNKVRLTVEVPPEDLEHAVEHATSDLAGSVKVPGFRQGKVPTEVLQARIGRERIFKEAVESHIGGWFMNAAAGTRIRPIAAPEYEYELPTSEDAEFSFTATVPVQPTPEPADWAELEVPYAEPEIPEELVEQELEELRASVAELAPVDGRPARTGDVLVVDALDESGEGQRDLVVELGSGRLVEEIERALTGASQGETKQVEFELADGSTGTATVEVKELKEKVLPPLDDDLARAASEFDTLKELREDIERRLREVLEEEAETQFRAAAVDRLVEASNVQVGGPLVEARTRELLNALGRSLERRGISAETYFQLSGQTADQLVERMGAEAALSVARELVLEAVADKLRLEVSDEEIEELIREQADLQGDDADEAVKQVFADGRQEVLRGDLRLRKALDRVAADAKRVPPEVARARDEIWTPDKETPPTETKLWTPGSKEPA